MKFLKFCKWPQTRQFGSKSFEFGFGGGGGIWDKKEQSCSEWPETHFGYETFEV